MKNLSKFQLIFYGVFVLAIFAGVGILAISKANNSASKDPADAKVTMWGVQPSTFMEPIIAASGANVVYSQKSADTFYQSYIEALANGKGPDLLLLTQADVYRFISRLAPIPYQNFPERTFRDQFVDGAEVFLHPAGILGFPIGQNPLVMYWNKDMITSAGLVAPPTTWDKFPALVPLLTKKDGAQNIVQAPVALGEYGNVTNAKAILSSLIMQAGGKVVDYVNGNLGGALMNTYGNTLNPAVSSLDFYTQFSNPVKATYTWNRSLASSKTLFLNGSLAVYFGFASEAPELRAKNPNLDFDVAVLPQANGTNKKAVYADFYLAAISRSTTNYAAAFKSATLLSSAGAALKWAPARTDIVPAQKAALMASPERSADTPVFYSSALWGRTWIDPNAKSSDNVFGTMIGDVTAGRTSTGDAVKNALGKLNSLF